MRLKLVGANPAAMVKGLEELPGKSNYFIGNDPKKWRTNVPNYAKVQYNGVYPGVDLVYYGNQRQLEYDFVVAPGADPRAIKLAVAAMLLSRTGDTRQDRGELRPPLQIDANGDLVVGTGDGELRFHKPMVYQQQSAVDGRRAEAEERSAVLGAVSSNRQSTIDNRQYLDGQYVISGESQVTFEVASYDRTKPLVIDPTLAFSTYLGGSGYEGQAGSRIAVDPLGNVYVAGITNSVDFPTTSGSFQPVFGGGVSPCDQVVWGVIPELCGDGFVAKLNPTGAALIYSTYIGGSRDDGVVGLAVDASGNAYLAGFTNSYNFPITAGAFQSSFGGEDPTRNWELLGDGFVTELNPSGSGLVYSTYLGGTENEYARAIAVDSLGKIYVGGTTDSTNFPTTGGSFQPVWSGGWQQAFLAKIDPLQSGAKSLIYSTYLGSVNGLYNVAVDGQGNLYATGNTAGPDNPFPITEGAFQTTSNVATGFVTKLNAAGSDLDYSTFLGGSSGSDVGVGIAVDSSGDAYVFGGTSSTDFPVTSGAFQTTYGGGGDDFVAKLDPSGSTLVYSTYLGGSGGDGPGGLAIDSAGNAFVVGATSSTDFPLLNPIQSTFAGSGDATVTELNPLGSALVYSTYLGGTNNNSAYYVAVDSSDNTYVTGWTTSTDFPITPGALQANNAGNYDMFVAKIRPDNLGPSTYTPIAEPLTPTGGTNRYQFFGNLFNYKVTYPALSPPVTGVDLVVQPILISKADLNARLAGQFSGATLVPYDGTGGYGVLFRATCQDHTTAEPTPCPHTTGPHDVYTSWNSPSGQTISNLAFLMAEIAPVGQRQQWTNIFTAYSQTRIDPTVSGRTPPSYSDFVVVQNISGTPPTIAITTPPPNAVYVLNENVLAEYSCSGSVVSCLGTVPSGSPINTLSLGTNPFEVNAIVSSGPSADQTVTYQVVPGPLAVSPSIINFGTVYLGTITIRTVTVTNQGTAPVTITDPRLSILSGGNSKQFAALNLCPKSLAAGKGCMIVVSFLAGPHYNTPQTATLSVMDSAPTSPQTVALSATVINPQASLSSYSLNFGKQKVGTTSAAPKTVTLTNTGTTSLTLSTLNIRGDFSFATGTTCTGGETLTAGASCLISVNFTPTAKGARLGSVTIKDNALLKEQIIVLSGTGYL